MQTAIGGDYGSVVIRKRGNDRLFSLGRACGERHVTIILLDNRSAVDCACFPHACSLLASDDYLVFARLVNFCRSLPQFRHMLVRSQRLCCLPFAALIWLSLKGCKHKFLATPSF
jgi:hypothetical protein